MLKSKNIMLGAIIAVFSIGLIFNDGLQLYSISSNAWNTAGDIFPNTELPFEN